MSTSLVKRETSAMVHQPRKRYYRYDDRLYTETRLMLVKQEFFVISKTPKGVWIDVYGSKRFVLSSARKKFACSTEKEALASFYARKTRQAAILRYKLIRAQTALTLTEKDTTQYMMFADFI